MKLKRTVSSLKIQPKYPQNFLNSTPNYVEQPDLSISETDERQENYDDYDLNSYPLTENRPFFAQNAYNKGETSMRSIYESPDFVQRGSKISNIPSFEKFSEESSIKPKEFKPEEQKDQVLLNFLSKLKKLQF